MLRSLAFLRGVPSLNTDASGAAPPDAFGPFRVLHQIGAGALGPVFRAYQPEQDRLVAVKLFRLDLPPERAHQLVSEFEQLIAADLSHPGIAAPLAAGIAGVHAYLAQDFVAAESLDVVIRDSGPASIDTIARVATQLGNALDHAATAHILHGALHPRDILMSTDDARMTGLGMTRALAQVGVPAPVRRPYTAPERIAGLPWDQRADVFSLGALLFELVSGRRPSGVGDEAANSLPDAIAVGDRHALRPVFAKAMAGNPAARFDSGGALAQALIDALTQRPIVRREGSRKKKFVAELPGLLPEAEPVAAAADMASAVPTPTQPFVEPIVVPEHHVMSDELPVIDASAPEPADEPRPAPPKRPRIDGSTASRRRRAQALLDDPPALEDEPRRTSPESSASEPAPVDYAQGGPDFVAETPEPSFDLPVLRDDGRHDVGDLHLTPVALDHDPLDLHLVSEPAHLPLDEPLQTNVLAVFTPEPEVDSDVSPAAAAPADVEFVHGHQVEHEAEAHRGLTLYGDTPDTPLEPVAVDAPMLTEHEAERDDVEPDHFRPREPRPSPFVTQSRETEPVRSSLWPLAAALIVGIGIGFGLAFLTLDRGAAPVVEQRVDTKPPPIVIVEPPVVTPAPPAASTPSQPASRTTAPAAATTDPRTAEPPRPAEVGTAAPTTRPSPPARPAATAAKGTVIVRTTPAGASVQIDGKDVGSTPLTARELANGAHTIRMTHAGYLNAVRRVTLTDAKPTQTVSVDMQRARTAAPGAAAAVPAPAAPGSGALVVDSRPSGAQVFVDGKPAGKTPLVLESVSSGDHSVRLDLTGYKRWASEVKITAGERSRLAASLER